MAVTDIINTIANVLTGVGTCGLGALTIYLQFFKKFSNYDIEIIEIESCLVNGKKGRNAWAYRVKNNTTADVGMILPALALNANSGGKKILITNHKILGSDKIIRDSCIMKSTMNYDFIVRAGSEVQSMVIGFWLDWLGELEKNKDKLAKSYKQIKQDKKSIQMTFPFHNVTQHCKIITGKKRRAILKIIEGFYCEAVLGKSHSKAKFLPNWVYVKFHSLLDILG